MKVSAVIVTRGDVDLGPILRSLRKWEVVVWDNGAGKVTRYNNASSPLRWYAKVEASGVDDLAVYGRYAAIEYARGDLIYTQDDDCIVSDPQAIVDALIPLLPEIGWVGSPPGELFLSTLRPPVVCNMPEEFRHDFYVDHALVGFGSAFHRDAPEQAFERFNTAPMKMPAKVGYREELERLFNHTCDIVFTALTPRVLVDVPKENLPYASDDYRMWRQPTHQGERAAMLELVRNVKGSP